MTVAGENDGFPRSKISSKETCPLERNIDEEHMNIDMILMKYMIDVG